EHRAGLHKRFVETGDGHLDREPARLPDAALDLFSALAEVRVTGIQVRPGVENGNDRLALPIGAAETHLGETGALPKRPPVIRPEPAVRSELFWRFANGRHSIDREGELIPSTPIHFSPGAARPH